MSQSDRIKVRFEQPLIIQTRADRNKITKAKEEADKALENLSKILGAQLEALEESVHAQVKTGESWADREFYNNVAQAAYFEMELRLSKELKAAGIEHTWDPARNIVQGLVRGIWNEAIELAAQVTGGAQGTLIRDLKEGE